jgi:hypothetical protein
MAGLQLSHHAAHLYHCQCDAGTERCAVLCAGRCRQGGAADHHHAAVVTIRLHPHGYAAEGVLNVFSHPVWFCTLAVHIAWTHCQWTHGSSRSETTSLAALSAAPCLTHCVDMSPHRQAPLRQNLELPRHWMGPAAPQEFRLQCGRYSSMG